MNFGSLVQSAGLVWTDGSTDLDLVRFEAFDQDGESLGVIESADIGDDSFNGTTAEDRFFGVQFGDGITTGVTSLVITNIGGTGIEIDHIQFANCSACCDIDLELSKEVDATLVQSGDEVTWTINLTNNAETAQVDATGVEVSDVIPDGLSVLSVQATNGVYDEGSGIWTLSEPLGPGEVDRLTVVTTVDNGLAAGTVIRNIAEVTAADQVDVDSTPGNDDGDQSEDDEDNALISIGGVIDLELVKSTDVTLVAVGDTVNWRLTLTNDEENANTDATGVVVRDVLPSGLELVNATPSGAGSFLNDRWVLNEPVSPGEVRTLDLETVVQAGFAGSSIVNVAEVVAANEPDVDSVPNNDDGDQSEDDEDNATITVEAVEEVTSLSGFAYVDVNNDGIFQDAEMPLMGVEIQLVGLDEANQSVLRSTFTNIDGLYRFADLAPGSYVVSQVQPIQFVDGKDTLGNLGGDDSVNDQFTVNLTSNGEDYNFGELGLRGEYVSKRLYLTSTPYSQWQYIDVRQASIWHSFDTEHATLLELNASVQSGEVQFSVFDESMELVAERSGGVLASPIALPDGGTFYLEISGEGELADLSLELNAPEVTQEGNKVVAIATPGDDDVVLVLGSESHVLNISGLEYTFDATEVTEFHLGSSDGDDQVTIHGTNRDDTGNVLESRGTLVSNDYRVETYTFDKTTFVGGGGNDYAQIYGSTQDDRLAALPQDTSLTTPDNLIHMLGYDRVDAYGRGGFDYASVYGTLGDDLYYARDEYALLQGEGMMNYTKGFERVDAFGRGGTDIAQLFDSVGNDEFVSDPTYAYLIGINRTSYTKGFERVDAISTKGGIDKAVFFDGEALNDTFVARRDYAYMTDGNYVNYANNFTRIRARSNGGEDTAQVLDLKTGDAFHAYDDVAAVLAAERDDELKGFDLVIAAAGAEESPTAHLAEIDYVLSEDVNWA